jgi:hypothetical protein
LTFILIIIMVYAVVFIFGLVIDMEPADAKSSAEFVCLVVLAGAIGDLVKRKNRRMRRR